MPLTAVISAAHSDYLLVKRGAPVDSSMGREELVALMAAAARAADERRDLAIVPHIEAWTKPHGVEVPHDTGASRTLDGPPYFYRRDPVWATWASSGTDRPGRRGPGGP